MIPYVWFVSKTVPPAGKAVIADMASAFRARGGKLTVYIDGPTGGVETDGVYAWKSLTGMERIVTILCPTGALWHLWGTAPAWWWMVRLRARAAHTAFDDNPSWKGYPSRLFPYDAGEGEAVIIPTFNARISDNARSGSYQAGSGADPALQAAAMTMRGMVAVGTPSKFLNAMLGEDGYFHVQGDNDESRSRAAKLADSEEGRRMAASARHHIKTRFSTDKCADSLIALYRRIQGGKAK